MSIRVIIAGFKGKMGQAACQMVLADSDLDLVAVLDPFESESEWQGIPVFKDKADLAGFKADVWVDFTTSWTFTLKPWPSFMRERVSVLIVNFILRSQTFWLSISCYHSY